MILGGIIVLGSLFSITQNAVIGIGGVIVGLLLFPQTWSFLSSKINRKFTRKEKIIIIVTVFVMTPVLSGITASQSTPAKEQAPIVSQADKDKAQKDLDDLMSLGEKSGLVQSYSLTGDRAIYVGSIWYTQTVQFKKDLLAKITMDLAQIKGEGSYASFEVRDAYSNEKVAEVTSFGSLEVYK